MTPICIATCDWRSGCLPETNFLASTDACSPACFIPPPLTTMRLSSVGVYIAATLFSAATVHCQTLKVPNPPVMDTSLDGTWSTGTGAVETGQVRCCVSHAEIL